MNLVCFDESESHQLDVLVMMVSVAGRRMRNGTYAAFLSFQRSFGTVTNKERVTVSVRDLEAKCLLGYLNHKLTDCLG